VSKNLIKIKNNIEKENDINEYVYYKVRL
jgi:hypothetical protein